MSASHHYLENKGSAEHKMENFNFEIAAMMKSDDIVFAKEFGGQVLFSHHLMNGSFLPQGYKFFFVGPGIKAKYSFVTAVPADATS